MPVVFSQTSLFRKLYQYTTIGMVPDSWLEGASDAHVLGASQPHRASVPGTVPLPFRTENRHTCEIRERVEPRGENKLMNLVTSLLIIATAMNGLLSGLNVDTALVKLPARWRIGAVAYATFARGNDLGNGLVVYPLLGIGAALFTVLVTAVAYLEHSPMGLLLLLSLASLLSLLHTAATTTAAPVMLSIKDAPDDEAILITI